jgi:hypothetical protein
MLLNENFQMSMDEAGNGAIAVNLYKEALDKPC